MPTTRIEIENYNNAFHAEVELAGISARRVGLNAPTFPEIIAKIEETYYEFRPDERLPKAVAKAKAQAQPLTGAQL